MRKGSGNPCFGKVYNLTVEQKAEYAAKFRANGNWLAAITSPDFARKIAESQWKNIWLIVDQKGGIESKHRSASQVTSHLNEVLSVKCNVSNAKNARRRMRPVGKQSSSWYFICYEQDYEALITSKVFNEPVLIGGAVAKVKRLKG